MYAVWGDLEDRSSYRFIQYFILDRLKIGRVPGEMRALRDISFVGFFILTVPRRKPRKREGGGQDG